MLPIKDPTHPEYPHGTFYGYTGGRSGPGCRCDLCREARRERGRQDRQNPEYVEKQREIRKAYNKTEEGREAKNRRTRNRYYRLKDTPHQRARTRLKNSLRRAREVGAATGDAEIMREIYASRPDGYHVDHIVPLSRGGQHHEDNLQYLLAHENHRKSASVDYAPPPSAIIRWQDIIRK